MTYNTRVMKKEKGYIVNGSVAILIPKYDFLLTTEQMLFLSSLVMNSESFMQSLEITKPEH